MAHHHHYAGGAARFGQGFAGPADGDFDDDDDDSLSHPHDRIRRNYLQNQHQQYSQGSGINGGGGGGEQQENSARTLNGSGQRQETIRVNLNESYFANERRALVNLLANVRQKFNSMQMFNPAKNQSIKEQQEQWNENVSSFYWFQIWSQVQNSSVQFSSDISKTRCIDQNYSCSFFSFRNNQSELLKVTIDSRHEQKKQSSSAKTEGVKHFYLELSH